MRLYFYGLIMLIKKFVFRQNTGKVILSFSEKMGVVYIKLAQILAMQNYGNIFNETDRIALSKICDNTKPIKFKKIKKQIEKEYGVKLEEKFKYVDPHPIGAASISQVHKGILKNGEVVAIKVKRKDVTKRIEKDIRQIQRIVHRFGKFFHFKNFLGSDNALNLYLSWIKEEVDFEQERKNIQRYYKFATSVNKNISNAIDIKVPRLYKKLCTNNIIIMEFIFSHTINQMNLTKKNKMRITRALNDYIRLSFYAFFHDLPVVFHGDPHGGNIYIDKYGNIGFLDMGLIFEFDGEEKELIKKLFLSAYNGNVEKLIEVLLEASEYTKYDEQKFYKEIKKCCDQFKKIPVTQFFVEMIGVFTKYNINPPEVLFKMAKAFIALFGINRFIDNKLDTEKLLMEQVTEYYVDKTTKDIKDVFKTGSTILPSFISVSLKKGLVSGITEMIAPMTELNKKINKLTENCNELLEYFK